MNPVSRYFARRREAKAEAEVQRLADEVRARLARSLKPCPEIRERRYRAMSPERRAKAERNAAIVAELIGGAR